jgi:hypothetical protein
MNLKKVVGLTIAAFACIALPAHAVYLNPDGTGQALVFPYFTVQSVDANAYNTYISIVSASSRGRVVKVRFREGRNSRPLAELNVYLTGHDTWTAALVPDDSGARLITRDASCTNPPIPAEGMLFSNAGYANLNDDGAGVEPGRAREGHIDVIDMGRLPDEIASHLQVDTLGRPANCPAVQGPAPNLGVLSVYEDTLAGTATLINVRSGRDFTYQADALARLASAPMYSHPGQPGTDFDSSQVDPVSYMTDDGVGYHLLWSRRIDAVSSVFLALNLANDFVLDRGTRSATDWVVTFPTRRFYVTAAAAQAPFRAPFGPSIFGCEPMGVAQLRDRAARDYSPDHSNANPPSGVGLCWSSGVFSMRERASDRWSLRASDVFGSLNSLGLAPPFGAERLPHAVEVPPGVENGFLEVSFGGGPMTSLAGSSAFDLRTGAVTPGRFEFDGLPMTGFMARTFENGTLVCGSGSCQGNYGGSFTHRKRRLIIHR